MRASEEFFAFRQRVGKLNWKVISSIDMDDLVDKVSVGELQTVLDSLTFCQFTEKETNNQSSKLVTKACQLMQYTIEYLLHCQEMQAQRLDDASAANEELQMKHMKLKMAHIANKEAMRGYRAQLAEFKESARNLGLDGKLFPSTPTTNKMRVVMEPQRPDSSTAVVEKSNSSGGITAESLQRIVESIQQRETESVEQLAAVLRQQRDHFFREMDSGKENVSNSSVREETAAGMGQITALFESYKNQMQQEMARQFAANSSRASVSMDMATQEQKELEARVAAFEAEKTRWEEQREHAERELEEKAQEVKRARASVIPAQQSLSPYRPSRESTRSTTGVATSTSSLFADVSETPSESTAAAGVQQGSPSSPELTVVEVNYHRNALILIKHMLLRYFLRYSKSDILQIIFMFVSIATAVFYSCT